MDLLYYETENGKLPFNKWIKNLKDVKARAIINTRLDRAKVGDFGDHRHLFDTVYELKIHYGAGYRVYFSELKEELVILLILGGSKGTQEKDIKKVENYWHSFKERYLS